MMALDSSTKECPLAWKSMLDASSRFHSLEVVVHQTTAASETSWPRSCAAYSFPRLRDLRLHTVDVKEPPGPPQAQPPFLSQSTFLSLEKLSLQSYRLSTARNLFSPSLKCLTLSDVDGYSFTWEALLNVFASLNNLEDLVLEDDFPPLPSDSEEFRLVLGQAVSLPSLRSLEIDCNNAGARGVFLLQNLCFPASATLRMEYGVEGRFVTAGDRDQLPFVASSVALRLLGQTAIGSASPVFTLRLGDGPADYCYKTTKVTGWASMWPTRTYSQPFETHVPNSLSPSCILYPEGFPVDTVLRHLDDIYSLHRVESLVIDSSRIYNKSTPLALRAGFCHLTNVTFLLVSKHSAEAMLQALLPVSEEANVLFPSLKILHIHSIAFAELMGPGPRLGLFDSLWFLQDALEARAALGFRMDKVIISDCSNVLEGDLDVLREYAEVVWDRSIREE